MLLCVNSLPEEGCYCQTIHARELIIYMLTNTFAFGLKRDTVYFQCSSDCNYFLGTVRRYAMQVLRVFKYLIRSVQIQLHCYPSTFEHRPRRICDIQAYLIELHIRCNQPSCHNSSHVAVVSKFCGRQDLALSLELDDKRLTKNPLDLITISVICTYCILIF